MTQDCGGPHSCTIAMEAKIDTPCSSVCLAQRCPEEMAAFQQLWRDEVGQAVPESTGEPVALLLGQANGVRTSLDNGDARDADTQKADVITHSS